MDISQDSQQIAAFPRSLYDHKVTELNRQHVIVEALDVRNDDGANHKYSIAVVVNAVAPDGTRQVIESCILNFQNGGLREVGPNGITDQALLAIVLDRLRGFQSGPFSCRENAIAITKLEEALMWTGKRAADRAARGVEGTRAA